MTITKTIEKKKSEAKFITSVEMTNTESFCLFVVVVFVVVFLPLVIRS